MTSAAVRRAADAASGTAWILVKDTACFAGAGGARGDPNGEALADVASDAAGSERGLSAAVDGADQSAGPVAAARRSPATAPLTLGSAT
eukprot:365569-Chlamydomonas_euryale.AAC.33